MNLFFFFIDLIGFGPPGHRYGNHIYDQGDEFAIMSLHGFINDLLQRRHPFTSNDRSSDTLCISTD